MEAPGPERAHVERAVFAEAHRLKGAAGTLLLARLEAVAGELARVFGDERSGDDTLDLEAVAAARTELAAAAAADEPLELPTDRPGAAVGASITVLHVEDDEITAALVERSLSRQAGMTLLTAREGGPAIELAREHRPDLVLLDLHLPDMGGAEVADRLREDPATAEIPIVITSGGGSPGEVDRLLAAGARGYLQKPLELKRLRELVVSVASQR